MYHIFLIHSSVSEHLCFLHVMAIVNSAAMNIQVRVSFSKKFLSGYVPRSGTAGSCVSSTFRIEILNKRTHLSLSDLLH